MQIRDAIGNHIRSVFFGGNWTDVNLKDTLSAIEFSQATRKIDSFNSIAALVFHINYFVEAVLQVLQEGRLDAHDKYSFDLPPMHTEKDWEDLKNKLFTNAALLASLAEQIPQEKLWEDFLDPKYGTYYKNLHGIIEHTHYHLGQIVILRKMLLKSDEINKNSN